MSAVRECFRPLVALRKYRSPKLARYIYRTYYSQTSRNLSACKTHSNGNWIRTLCTNAEPSMKEDVSQGPGQKFEFQAETRMLLDIVAKSLYSEKEVFLRELISNASDALEKARYYRISEGAPPNDSEMKITVSTNKQDRTIVIEDNGIGMSKDELIRNLGTIARSGSKAFIDELKKRGQSNLTNTVIGQFGVGFYSVFMVADKVEVFTKTIKPGSEGLKWSSDGSGSFEISPVERADPGTKIVIYLKTENREFADNSTVNTIIKKYSSFVSYPIILDGAQANTIQPLWLMNPREVSIEKHKEFYKYMTNANDSPRFVLHYKVDVPYSINAVLYFPESRPVFFDPAVHGGIALFARRVLIKNKAEEIIPKWLRFVRGVVDSEDIPLNLSREILQNTALLRTISSTITKKIIKFLQERSAKDKENYTLFYREFGLFFKEGIIAMDNKHDREDISKLLLYETSKTPAGQLTSIQEYVSKMQADQKKIYYLSAPSRSLAMNSPYMEALIEKDVEVIFCYEPYDEFVLMQLHSVNDIPLCSVEASARLHTPTETSSSVVGSNKENNIDELLTWMKQTLKEKIEKAIVNKSLKNHPCIVTVEEMAHARQYLKLQARGLDDDMKYTLIKPRLELNPNHPLINQVKRLIPTNEKLATLITEQLFKNALVYAGLLEDARKVVDNVNKIMELVLEESHRSEPPKQEEKTSK
ncbi:heat shock protein 75 kDa, mitochondrial [Cimex lectularius]|uniref:Heat shock protein 83 n=1 Tax=Cimex lectularius TaxID=79782 RepID=A0A8I6RLP0_CIMLE|nr:heat shock protein 75 kDa, mitochondrial [Cimex lectularius]